MSNEFDIDAYKTARLNELNKQAQEDMVASLASLHLKMDEILHLLKGKKVKE